MKWWTVEQLELRQDNDPPHPLEDMSFSLIETFHSDLKKKYPEAHDFRYVFIQKPCSFGAMDYWYELQILM